MLSIYFVISSSANAFNLLVLILPRLPTFRPNSIAAPFLGVSKIPLYCLPYLSNFEYNVNMPPIFQRPLFLLTSLRLEIRFLILTVPFTVVSDIAVRVFWVNNKLLRLYMLSILMLWLYEKGWLNGQQIK